MKYYVPNLGRNPTSHPFLFATGIENSYPVIAGKDGRPKRRDEMAEAGHYKHWKEDFQLVVDMGLRFLRCGPPYYKVHLGSGKYDWDFVDETFGELKRLGIVPIADLCHFGLPDWVGSFQNPDWPQLFADYAQAFARRYNWVRLYTPVNEIFICARFSALLGWWNERLSSERAFVAALKHLVQANILAQEAVLQAQPQAMFIQSESSDYFHPVNPSAMDRAGSLNEQRFLSLDLCYGHDVSASSLEYLMDNGMLRDEYAWFMEHGTKIKPFCIMGNDYYDTNEHSVPPEGPLHPSGEIFGYYIITHQYFERYHLPVMHTETNIKDAERAPAWLRKEWAQMVRLKQDGVPIIGFTWYSLTDQIDWDTAMREENGTVNPCGLFDLNRRIRPVGEAYRKLVEEWRDILPMESQGVDLPLPHGAPKRQADHRGKRMRPDRTFTRARNRTSEKTQTKTPHGR